MTKRRELPEEAYEYRPYNNRPDSIPEDSPFAKYYHNGEITRFSKCGTNEHWVKTHTTKDGIVISGHCAKDPRRR